MRKTIRVARRVVGNCHHCTLTMRCIYAEALYKNAGATPDDLREAVTTLEDAGRIARRVLGGAHPLTPAFENCLKASRGILAARQTPPGSS